MGEITYIDFLAKFGIGGAHPGGIPLTQDMLSGENITEKSIILDAGCGTGQTTAYLYQQYKAQIFGIEINPIMLEKAKNRFKTLQLPIQLVQGSIEKLPFEDNSFDFILSESVLAFVNKPKALKEFYRVLKPNGRLIANEMTINQKLQPQDEAEIKKFYGLDSVFLAQDWHRLLTLIGFSNIEIKAPSVSMSQGNSAQEFNFSSNFEPELFDILNKHGNIIIKYQDILSFRIITSRKQ